MSYLTPVYINAYAVTRHYGGPEEGGWHYDAGHPVESRCVHMENLPEPEWTQPCSSCNGKYPERESCDWCNGNGTVAPSQIDDEELSPFNHYDILDVARQDTRVGNYMAEMQEHWAEYDEGDISSVNGGVKHCVRVELAFAEPWPKRRPHYE